MHALNQSGSSPAVQQNGISHGSGTTIAEAGKGFVEDEDAQAAVEPAHARFAVKLRTPVG